MEQLLHNQWIYGSCIVIMNVEGVVSWIQIKTPVKTHWMKEALAPATKKSQDAGQVLGAGRLVQKGFLSELIFF